MRRVGFTLFALLMCLLAGVALSAPVRVQVQVSRLVADDVIEQEFNARSTPGSPQFRQHMSIAELTKLVRGRPESLAAVANYLRSVGATDISTFETQDVITATIPSATSHAATALSVPRRMFAVGSKRMPLPTPAALRDHAVRIVAVGPKPKVAKKSYKSKHRATDAKLQEPGTSQTPQSIRTRYNVPDTPVTSATAQGVGEFQSSYFNTSWITNFTAKFNITNTPVLVRGPNAPSGDDQEGPLDLQYMIAMAPGASTWWISSNDTSNNPYGIDFAWWCNEVTKLTPMPTVVSLSWGLGEAEYYLKGGLMFSDNDAFRKLGLLGVSIFVASGDAGPGGRNYMSCNHFDPSWPASSQYVTAVGATFANANNDTEIAVRWSGGGFSDYLARPSWQDAAVEGYFKAAAAHLPNATYYNASGRAFPDVAALGTNFQVFGDMDGYGDIGWYFISGTSCASPTFAGIVSRINALRAAKGKGSLGFLNPSLYKMGSIGYDVVNGYNLDQDCFGFAFAGFTTAKGWDPVTGLGTPKFDVLVAGLMD